MLSLITGYGRATADLADKWVKATPKEPRNAYEDRVLWRLREVVPEGVGC